VEEAGAAGVDQSCTSIHPDSTLATIRPVLFGSIDYSDSVGVGLERKAGGVHNGIISRLEITQLNDSAGWPDGMSGRRGDSAKGPGFPGTAGHAIQGHRDFIATGA